MTVAPPPPASPSLDRRAFVLGGTMLAAAGAAAARLPEPVNPPIGKQAFEGLMPDTVGPWRYQQSSGLVLPPEDALSDRLYDNIVTRVYAHPQTGKAVMMLIAYKNFQNGVLQIHRPEICYPAGGYALSPTQPTRIAVGPGRSLPANSFSAVGAERNEQVLYWTRIGDMFPVRWIEQRWAVLRANLNQINPDGMLARVSMANESFDASVVHMTDFIEHLRLAAPTAMRRILFGPLA